MRPLFFAQISARIPQQPAPKGALAIRNAVIKRKKSMEVYISANAFWALLVSAIEVYKRECFGMLLGYRDASNILVVEHAISFQTANRRHPSVKKNGRASRRINKFLTN